MTRIEQIVADLIRVNPRNPRSIPSPRHSVQYREGDS